MSTLGIVFTEKTELSGYLVYNLLLALARVRVKILVFGNIRLSVAVSFVIITIFNGAFQRLQLLYLVHRPGGKALALGLKALDGDELFRVDFHRVTVRVVAAEGDAEARIRLICKQNEAAVLVFSPM